MIDEIFSCNGGIPVDFPTKQTDDLAKVMKRTKTETLEPNSRMHQTSKLLLATYLISTVNPRLFPSFSLSLSLLLRYHLLSVYILRLLFSLSIDSLLIDSRWSVFSFSVFHLPR